jgi:methanogenic corrinoid protein MtbC1
MLARRPGARAAVQEAPPPRKPTEQDVVEFARLLLIADPSLARGFIETLRAQHVSLETVFLELLAPSARHLGKLWEEDLCDFTEVTLGLCRLHQVLRELSPAFSSERAKGQQARRALLVPAPGEHHTFGLSMVVEFFRRAGWDVCSEYPSTSGDLATIVRGEWFAVVGLSVGCENRLDALASSVRAVRRSSTNRDVGVMVGGRVFLDHPELVSLVGADATASDGRDAVLQAEEVFSLLARRF